MSSILMSDVSSLLSSLMLCTEYVHDVIIFNVTRVLSSLMVCMEQSS
jgi:hypothetical protein